MAIIFRRGRTHLAYIYLGKSNRHRTWQKLCVYWRHEANNFVML